MTRGFSGYGPQPYFSAMPPTLTARMDTWEPRPMPPLDALQEMGDYVWQAYDRGLIDVKLEPQLSSEAKQLRSMKRSMHPDTWEKVEEEWQELLVEVEPVSNPDKLEPFHIKGGHDQPFNDAHWVQFLAALKWPFIPLQRFMEFERLKIDGRLRYQAANPTIPKEQRKADLKQYETQAAKYVFNA